jgi:hypothetical protein
MHSSLNKASVRANGLGVAANRHAATPEANATNILANNGRMRIRVQKPASLLQELLFGRDVGRKRRRQVKFGKLTRQIAHAIGVAGPHVRAISTGKKLYAHRAMPNGLRFNAQSSGLSSLFNSTVGDIRNKTIVTAEKGTQQMFP